MGASSRAKRSNVKGRGPSDRETKGFSRHFEGWQPGLLAVFLAGSSALVAVPRSVDPVELPEPALSPRALERVARHDEALAVQAEAEAAREQALDFDVRALGSAIRAYGLADANGDDLVVTAARTKVAEAAQRARAHGEEPLAKLRAFQQRAFLRALRHWEAKGVERPDLRELGGAFVAMAGRNGWVSEGAMIMDEPVRRALFKKRWNELTMTRGPRFDLDVDEHRALLRFLLRNPPRSELDANARPRGVKPHERAAFAAGQYQMKKIEELAAVDPAYPADLARGVVLYGLHRYATATELFRRHLDAHPDGPFALRAQNYLKATLVRAVEETP